MAIPLATAFVRVRADTSRLKPDVEKGMAGAGPAGAKAGAKAGDEFAKAAKKRIIGVSKDITLGLAAAGVALAANGVRMAVQFQSDMKLLTTQAGVAQKQMGTLTKGVLDLAGQVGFSPDSLSQALFHIESNFSSLGITGPRALKLGAAEASGIKGVRNFGQAMGILNAIVGSGDMHMQDLAEALGTGALAAVKQYGVSIKDAGAALAVFGDNNIRGAHAGTALRVAVQSLSVPTSAGVKLLGSLGIKSSQLAGDLQKGGLKLALEDLTKHFQKAGVTGDKMGQIVTAAFGKKAGVGLSILLGQMDRFESKYPALTKGAGNFSSAWQQTKKTVAQQVKELQGSFDTFEIRLGQRLLPVLIRIFKWAKSNTGVIIGVAAAIGGLAITITTVNAAIKVWNFLQGVWTLAVKASAAATALWDGVLKITAISMVALKDAAIGAKIAAIAGAAASKVAAAAQWLWNVAMDANPIGLVVIAIAALVGAIIYAYTHFKWFRDFVQAVWRDIRAWTADAWHFILGAVRAAWDWIKQNWPLLLGIITGPIGLAAALIFKYWDKITAAAKFLWGALKTGFDDVWGAVKDGVKALLNIVLNVIGGVIDHLANWFGGLPFGIGSSLKAAAAKVDEFRRKINGMNFDNHKVALTFSLNLPPGVSYPSRHIKGRHAEGWRVPGYGGGDQWPALLEGGEAVVPKHLVPVLAPFLAANRVPGFAAGGLVGVDASLPPTAGLTAAFVAFAVTLGKQIASVIDAHLPAAGTGGFGSGALGGDAAANMRLARQLFPWPASMWPAYFSLEMREAGFNRFARNPTSGAYGIPQALPPTKMPFAAQAAGGSHAGPQLGWQFGYISGRYINPANAWGHELRYGWYDRSGWLMPGLTLAENRTGRPERVISPDQESALAGSRIVNLGGVVVREQADIDLIQRRIAFALGG